MTLTPSPWKVFAQVLLGLAVIAGVAFGPMLSKPCCPVPAAQAGAGRGAIHPAYRNSTVTLDVRGLRCASCPVTVRTALRRVSGVVDAKVSLPDGTATVEYDASRVGPQELVDAVERAGYRAAARRLPEGS